MFICVLSSALILVCIPLFPPTISPTQQQHLHLGLLVDAYKTILLSPNCYPINSLGGCAVCAVVLGFFSDEFQLKHFRVGAETKTGLSCSRIKTKVPTWFQVCCFFNVQTGESCHTQVFWVCYGISIISCISNNLEVFWHHTLVQHHQNMSNPLIEQCKLGVIFQT